jgi:hypothetical protein
VSHSDLEVEIPPACGAYLPRRGWTSRIVGRGGRISSRQAKLRVWHWLQSSLGGFVAVGGGRRPVVVVPALEVRLALLLCDHS